MINKEECSQEIKYPCNNLKLDTKANVLGYQTRYQNGVESAKKIIDLINSKTLPVKTNANKKIEDRIDIVCHSMGYAHAQGMVDYLDVYMAKIDGKLFGRFYILAPENGCSGKVKLADFESVWQYGSDEKDEEEPLWFKDGVAPQCAVGGIEPFRAYIPKDGTVPRGFVESHKVSNFEKWIFRLDEKARGYIPSR